MVSTHCSISLPGFARLYATPQAQKTKSSALLLSALVLCPFAHADNVVVGNGTPASCTEAALNAAMFQLVVGVQGPGGVLTFSCGASLSKSMRIPQENADRIGVKSFLTTLPR